MTYKRTISSRRILDIPHKSQQFQNIINAVISRKLTAKVNNENIGASVLNQFSIVYVLK
jgi:hypothetical protein